MYRQTVNSGEKEESFGRTSSLIGAIEKKDDRHLFEQSGQRHFLRFPQAAGALEGEHL